MDKTFKYGMRARGFSVGCQPLKGLVDAAEDPSGNYYNILTYDRELDESEVQQYELDDLRPPKVPNLSVIRRQKGITQKELSRLANLKNPRQVEYWESKPGRFNGAHLDSALAIADALGVDVKELMD